MINKDKLSGFTHGSKEKIRAVGGLARDARRIITDQTVSQTTKLPELITRTYLLIPERWRSAVMEGSTAWPTLEKLQGISTAGQAWTIFWKGAQMGDWDFKNSPHPRRWQR